MREVGSAIALSKMVFEKCGAGVLLVVRHFAEVVECCSAPQKERGSVCNCSKESS